mmetsp:Transcript_141776/g.264213  ORF Transcript_141776/g.264213 Transcript_141776/m.264213 type:complete len:93 (-) Transcript_141776:244-522(-)
MPVESLAVCLVVYLEESLETTLAALVAMSLSSSVASKLANLFPEQLDWTLAVQDWQLVVGLAELARTFVERRAAGNFAKAELLWDAKACKLR